MVTNNLFGQLTFQVGLASLLGVLGAGLAQAEPTDEGGDTWTDTGAEACRAYYAEDAGNIIDTVWGIQNIGDSQVWVSCPVVAQQAHRFPLDGTNDRNVEVVGYTEDPNKIVCTVRVQNWTGSAVETKAQELTNTSSTPFDYSRGFIPGFGAEDQWTINALAYKTVLWCRLPPGAFLYTYALYEQDD